MRITPLLPLLMLAGCATTAEGIIADKPPMRVYDSTKAPDVIAQCMADKGFRVQPMHGNWSASWNNQVGIVLHWFIQPKAAGSTIELRRTQSIAPGIKNAEGCF